MVKKIIYSAIIFALLVLPLVAAYKTEIIINTEPNQLVSINVFDPASDNRLFNCFERADERGIYSRNISTTSEEINVVVESKDNENVIIGSESLTKHLAGNVVYLDFVETETEELEEETIIDEGEEIEEEIIEEIEEEPENAEVTGFIIFGEEGFLSKTKYYLIGLVFIVGVLIFFIVGKKKNFFKHDKQIVTKKLSEIKDKSDDKKDELLEAEEKIKEAQEEIKKLKDQKERNEKISAAEEKLKKDQEELKKLRED